MLKKHVCGLLYNDRKTGPTFCHAILYQAAVFVPTLSCEEAPLSKVDVQKFSKQFHQEASQEAAQGIIRNVASGGSSLFLISDSVFSGLQSRSVGIR